MNTKIKTTRKANARIFDAVMYPTLKLEKLHRLRNTLEGGMNTQVLKALPIHPLLEPWTYYFRYSINTREDKTPCTEILQPKKSQHSVFRKFQTNHSTIIKEKGKALGMGYINKVLF